MGFANDHQAAFVCSHIFYNTQPILLVIHEDGDWQFLCGGDHPHDELPRVVGLGHLLSRDPSLFELEDLVDGWEATRAGPSSSWERHEVNS